jgi:hypothetical protein
MNIVGYTLCVYFSNFHEYFIPILLWFSLSLKYSVKRRTKDIDQIQDELQAIAEGHRSNTDYLDPDVSGGGQFVCIPCSRVFINARALEEHKKTKPHKKRLKLIAEPQYTQKEADAAAGLGHAP